MTHQWLLHCIDQSKRQRVLGLLHCAWMVDEIMTFFSVLLRLRMLQLLFFFDTSDFKHFRMLGPHSKFEVHTSFSCRDRANDAHKFSTNLRHYPYAKALARLPGESCQHNFYFDAFSGPLKFIKEWLSYGDYPALSLILTAIVDSHEDFEHL